MMKRDIDITWNITKKCFFTCQICATRNTRTELSFQEKERVLESLCSSKGFRIRELDFAGGDPLVDSDSTRIVLMAQKRLGKAAVSVTTTWKGIERVDENCLEDLLFNCELTIDTDEVVSLRKEPYYSCGNLRAIQKYSNYFKTLTINIPVGYKYNETDLEGICNTINRIKCDNIRVVLIRLMPVGCVEGNNYMSDFDNVKTIEFFKKHLCHSVKLHLHCVLRGYFYADYQNCGMVHRKLGIDCAGNVFSCAWAGDAFNNLLPSDNPFYLGNVLIDGMERIVTSQRAKQLLQTGKTSNTKCPLLYKLRGNG